VNEGQLHALIEVRAPHIVGYLFYDVFLIVAQPLFSTSMPLNGCVFSETVNLLQLNVYKAARHSFRRTCAFTMHRPESLN
jgi:hypothetical protein